LHWVSPPANPVQASSPPSSEAILAFLGKTEVGLERLCDEGHWGGGSVSFSEGYRLGEEKSISYVILFDLVRKGFRDVLTNGGIRLIVSTARITWWHLP